MHEATRSPQAWTGLFFGAGVVALASTSTVPYTWGIDVERAALLLCLSANLPGLFLAADAVPRERSHRMWLMLSLTPGGPRGVALTKLAGALLVGALTVVGLVLALVATGALPPAAAVGLLGLWLAGVLFFTGFGALVGHLARSRLEAASICAAAALLAVTGTDRVLGPSLEALSLGWLVALNPFNTLLLGTFKALTGWSVALPLGTAAAGAIALALSPLLATLRGVER